MKDQEFSIPFCHQIRCKLLEADVGSPLIIYLHGYKQNLNYFEKRVQNLLSVDAHHLLLQGPYPVYDEKHQREVENWGRAWYLYDGRQEQFKKSLEKTSAFIDDIIENVSSEINYSNVTVFGYSMGGYLAGYYTLSRPNMIDNLIVAGGRIKSEWFTGNSYEKLNVLALHGSTDETVMASPAEKSSHELKEAGATVTFKTIEEGHRLNKAYIDEVKKWMERRMNGA